MAGAPGDGIAVWRPEMSAETRFFGQLGLGYALNPLRVDNYVHNLNDADKIKGNPLTSQLIGYADVGVEILGRVSLQVSFPFVAYQAGNPTNDAAGNLPQPSVDLESAAPGDLRLEARGDRLPDGGSLVQARAHGGGLRADRQPLLVRGRRRAGRRLRLRGRVRRHAWPS